MTTMTQPDARGADTQAGDMADSRAGETVAFGTFTLERTFGVAPSTVFAAWASRDSKHAWFAVGDDFLASVDEYRLEFRVGGQERLLGTLSGSGNTFDYRSTYGDIVDDKRIVATYDVLINDRRLSVSVLTVELQSVDGGQGTDLVLTEQGVFLDGIDTNAQRRIGAAESLDNLQRYLAQRSR